MGMIVTTSDGTRDSQGLLNWIIDVDAPEVDDLIWDAGAGSVLDSLEAAGLYDPNSPSDEQKDIDIAVAEAGIRKALETVDPDDDYLIPRLGHIQRVLLNGKARGAIYLTFE